VEGTVRRADKILAIVVALATAPGIALAQQWASGSIVNIFIDPNDLVLDLSQPGSCGSSYFVIQRSNNNFKEMVALSLSAFTANRNVSLWVVGCDGNRQIATHGFASR
jgi:hypothetical protein